MYRVLARSEEGIELVREYTPCRRTIKFGIDYYSLQFPYIIFLNKGYNTFVAFSPKSIKHKSDFVYMPPIGNIFESWNICGCETNIYQDEEDGHYQKPFSRTNRLQYGIKLFWQSTFTFDGFGRIVLRHTFGSHDNWSKKTLPEVLESIQYLNQHEKGILKTHTHDDDYVLTVMRTFKEFLDSDRRNAKYYGERLQMLQIHEITLDSEYEQTIQIPPNLSSALVAGNN